MMNGSPESLTFPRELVLASAGSGKTYHLSSRILGLLAVGVPASEVLATTFTRKAAGEILERALVRLAEGASDSEKARELGRDAHANLGDTEACRRVLARLLADLHRLNVGTLDAFFVRVAQNFFQELGLTPGWTIADQAAEERLRTEAVQAALSDAGRAELVELLRMITHVDADRRVHAAVLHQVDSLLAIHRQLDPKAVDAWSPGYGVVEHLPKETVRQRGRNLAMRLSRFEVPTTQAGGPRKSWLKARDNASNAIGALDWGTAFGDGIGNKVLTGAGTFDRVPIPSEFSDLFGEARTLARIDLAPKFRRESEAMGRLAELLAKAFDDGQRRLGAYRFEDITYLLGGPDPTGGREDLHYRLDQQVRHLLLDEFQDTSLEQWRALEPLAHELLSGHLNERAGVIVADTKQSIYGWRGARPELVRQVGKQHALAEATMGRSWRSSQVVLDLVADIFRDLPDNPVLKSIGVGERVASEWMEDFTELEAARDVPGHVCVHLAPAESGLAPIRPGLLRHSAELVKRLLEEMPGRTIGVLARRNRVVGHIMDELRVLGVRASGEGGTSLTDTAPANAILSLLRLADHPSDRVSLYHVASTPLGEIVGLQDRNDSGGARDLSRRVRTRLLEKGYGPCLAQWVLDLAPHCDAREVQRLLQLVELGHRWDERPNLRPADFARYVAREPVEDPSSARVQVMTVHRSKGMEFDVVVLPELYGSLAPKGEGLAVPERDRGTSRVVKVYPRIEKNVRMLFPEVDAALLEVKAAELRDGLSVLYVALTRARYALHVVLPPQGGSAKTSAGLIREALALRDEKVNGSGLLLERGNHRWFENLKESAEPTESAEPADRPAPPDRPDRPDEQTGTSNEKTHSEAADPSNSLLGPSTAGPGRNLARRSPSSLEGGDRVDLASTLRLDGVQARKRGELVHAWCKSIEWIEDGIGDDEALIREARSTAPDIPADQVSDLLAEFRNRVTVEPVRGALSRPQVPSDLFTTVRVENEFPFVRRMGDEIQEGFIDRLVLIQRDGRVVGAQVFDFKTDTIQPDDEETLAARTERYRPQIVAYCEVVREQHGLAKQDVYGTLIFLGPGVLVNVVSG
jgi:ATP-dependent helicase/nuclease subunit A